MFRQNVHFLLFTSRTRCVKELSISIEYLCSIVQILESLRRLWLHLGSIPEGSCLYFYPGLQLPLSMLQIDPLSLDRTVKTLLIDPSASPRVEHSRCQSLSLYFRYTS